jgi:hypothetical protein
VASGPSAPPENFLRASFHADRAHANRVAECDDAHVNRDDSENEQNSERQHVLLYQHRELVCDCWLHVIKQQPCGGNERANDRVTSDCEGDGMEHLHTQI